MRHKLHLVVNEKKYGEDGTHDKEMNPRAGCKIIKYQPHKGDENMYYLASIWLRQAELIQHKGESYTSEDVQDGIEISFEYH